MTRPLPRLACLLLPFAGLAACAELRPHAALPQAASVTVEAPEAWRQAATPADAALLDKLPETWARASAGRGGRRGALVDPRAGLARAAPSPGAYLCRFVSLGFAPPRARPDGFCFVGVEGERLSLTVEAGPERLGGYLFDDKANACLVFLGTAAPRPRGVLRGYGEDLAANVIGLFERIGPFRYRLAVPSRDGARLGLYEMTPAPVQ
ncbi:MAG TPA: DUF4893 domain-containing protein [Allosphingosinicella sp.]|jgi:hypothetical protein